MFQKSQMVLVAAALLGGTPAAAQMMLPSDVQPSCTVKPANFASWFQGRAVTSDGPVGPANSEIFPTDNTACDFHAWGAQMFLWLTSPEAEGRVLNGPALFNVLPADASGKRYLEENGSGAMMAFALRTEKFDEIGEVGQAGSGGTLLSQAGSLVYYGVHVNNVYGYFLSGQKNNALSQTEFPHTSADMDTLQTYLATAFPETALVAPETMVMEFKTSWVNADTVPDASQFVTIEATVPLFEANADNTVWTPQGATTKTLALTGMHIVGTVQNHPEFVWITYEHILNAPDADYYYTNIAGDVARQPYSSDGTFLFMASGEPEPQNIECAKESKGRIVANTLDSGDTACPGGVVASNTYRKYPWGSPQADQGHTAVANNTRLLSLNASIRSQLDAADARGNYVQTGGIWTSASSATADAPIPDRDDFTSGDLRGSLFAFNATMETYTQGTSCFSCHNQKASSANSFQPFELSHIYSQIVPLIAPSN